MYGRQPYDLEPKSFIIPHLFSVVMPAYNSSAYIATAIESVIAQKYESFELIIVDDGSKDSTKALAMEYALNDKRIIVLSNRFTKGAAGARNTAIQISKGEFISFLDSDDWWGPNVLLEQYKNFCQGHPILHSNIRVVNSFGDFQYRLFFPRRVGFRSMLFSNFMPNLTVSYSILKCGKHLAPCVRSRNDYALWLSLLHSTGFSSLNIGDVGAFYRLTYSGLSSLGIFFNIRMYIQVASKYINSIQIALVLPVYLFILIVKKYFRPVFNLACVLL